MRHAIPTRDAVETAMHDRLAVVAAVLAPETSTSVPTRDLLHEIALSVKRESTLRRCWLLFTAIAGAFPDQNDVLDLRRRLDLADDGGVLVGALAATLNFCCRTFGALRRLELVRDGVVVDVNFCATFEHNTGIQRVVRETVPRWIEGGRRPRLVAWTDDSVGFRDLDDIERDRVLNWNDRRRPQVSARPQVETLIVPWESVVFLPEVPLHSVCSPLAAISESSGNSVRLIGYDAIPLVSADGQRDEESERFAHYLSIVKHADEVIAISESAAEEFRGFTSALVAQGLEGPSVTAVPLAVEVPRAARDLTGVPTDRPLVLCVGSHEPRKNQEAVLAAGQHLAREGLAFDLVFVGNGSRRVTSSFDARAGRMRTSTFEVRSLRGLADAELWDLFARARFTVFVSLHEGFGLPVAESLALGVPVLTSDFGSLAEIAAMGGCVTVDPRDDDAIVAEMRRMLSDDELIVRLRAQAAAIPGRGWREYADELWSHVEFDELTAG